MLVSSATSPSQCNSADGPTDKTDDNDEDSFEQLFEQLRVMKGQYICIAPYCRQPTCKALRYGNALSRDLTVLPAQPRVYPRTE